MDVCALMIWIRTSHTFCRICPGRQAAETDFPGSIDSAATKKPNRRTPLSAARAKSLPWHRLRKILGLVPETAS
jgi:hypothetical protein